MQTDQADGENEKSDGERAIEEIRERRRAAPSTTVEELLSAREGRT